MKRTDGSSNVPRHAVYNPAASVRAQSVLIEAHRLMLSAHLDIKLGPRSILALSNSTICYNSSIYIKIRRI